MSENRPARRPRGPGGPGGPMMAMPGDKARDMKGTLKKLWRLMLRYRVGLIIVFIFAVGGATFHVVGPKILGRATTELFAGLMGRLGGGGINFAKIANILLSSLAIYAASCVLSIVQGWIMSGITQRTAYKLRGDLAEKLHRLPMRFYDRYTNGEIQSRVTNDVDTLAMNMNQVMTQVVSSVTTLIGVTCMMLTISWQMTLATFVTLPITAVASLAIMKRTQKYYIAQQESLAKVNGQVEEVFGGHFVIKAFNAENSVKGKFSKDNNDLHDTAWKSQFFSSLMMPIAQAVGNIGFVLVSILGGVLAAAGSITVGDIQAFVTYVRQFTQPISQIAQVGNMIQSMLAAAERVFNFLEEEEEDQEVANAVDAAKLEGRVTFDNISFGYVSGKTIIHSFNADINPGMKIAIVGPTGAGKTTIVKLLMRFYDVDDGAILVDGNDLRNFNRLDLRDLFGMVLQDTWLFSGSIMENIRYGRLGASDEEVRKAAIAADADHFIRTLPGGYDFVINEESSNISQGQKQLITIARALLANPKILILDEATSSVDTRTELRIQSAMHTLTKGRTSFIIAHRLSTIRGADLILFMKDGDIVEQGTHDDLLASGGFYSDLYQSQFAR